VPDPASLLNQEKLKEYYERDLKNALIAKNLSQKKIRENNIHVTFPINFTGNIQSAATDRFNYKHQELMSLIQIANNPFQAMAEVLTENEDQRGNIFKRKQLWYANEKVNCNTVFLTGDQRIIILSWTHPGFQLALSQQLNIEHDLDNEELTLISVKPLIRARFNQVIPQIVGLYDPLGRVRIEEAPEPKTGLKTVKFDMTSDQISAFISKMDGLLFVTGAPGSGKTTVAFQRVRFLINEYLNSTGRTLQSKVSYTPAHTRIFLGNQNLIEYSKDLITEGLELPAELIELVPLFINNYLGDIWQFKHEARARPRKLPHIEERARKAFFGLGTVNDLTRLWQIFELQISKRLRKAHQADWAQNSPKYFGSNNVSDSLATALSRCAEFSTSKDPLSSKLRLDNIYPQVHQQYKEYRSKLNEDDREQFDNLFRQWIYHVYDPLDAFINYWSGQLDQGRERMKKGTAFRADTDEVIQSLQQDWQNRYYGPEEEPWLAWMLRIILPETIHHENRFRNIPSSLSFMGKKEDDRWTHIVIDEAQDLCVAEASLLGSLVHSQGALTVSADFRQIVSPVWGMTDMSGFSIGNHLYHSNSHRRYPFAQNMRQSQQIALFLESFYKSAFGEKASFYSNSRIKDIKPQLYLCRISDFALRIRQIYNIVSRSSIESIALIQINEDQESMERLRANLLKLGVPLAEMWESKAVNKFLITTSVERIKGLEFDACIVLGLDDVERASLNFTTNRAYVALSRPTRRLAILCEEFPRLLQKVDQSLIEIFRTS